MKATGGFLLQLTSCAFALSGPWWWWFSMSWLVWLWKPSWTLQAEMTDAIFPAETQPLGLVTFGRLLMLSCYALGVWSMFSLARVPFLWKPGNSSGLKGGGTTQHISVCNQKTHIHTRERDIWRILRQGGRYVQQRYLKFGASQCGPGAFCPDEFAWPFRANPSCTHGEMQQQLRPRRDFHGLWKTGGLEQSHGAWEVFTRSLPFNFPGCAESEDWQTSGHPFRMF